MAPRYRAEHIGSLLRPAELVSARNDAQLFYYTANLPSKVKEQTDVAIASTVKKQLELGVRPVTDGEFRRFMYCDGLFEHLNGYKSYLDLDVVEDHRTNFPPSKLLARFGVKNRPGAIADSKIQFKESAYLEQWKQLRALVPKKQWGDCKITMVPIAHHHIALRPGRAYSREAYASDVEYFVDLATAYRQEIRTLYDAGLRNIQFDDPQLTFFIDPAFREGMATDGVDPENLLNLYIWAANEALKDKPSDLLVGLHLCRGNFPGSVHCVEGSYEYIKRVFTETKYDTFYLEYDTPRAGDFSPLRHVPAGKNVVLGLVSTKTPELEEVDGLVEKVYQASEVIAQGQGRTREEVIADTLAVSPQCGFSSVSVGGGIGMTEEIMWKKLELVKAVTKRIWEDV